VRIGTAVCALGLLLASLAPAGARDAPSARAPRRPPLRTEVTPPQYQRQCVDQYVIEHRASGDTVVPRMYCRWVLRR